MIVFITVERADGSTENLEFALQGRGTLRENRTFLRRLRTFKAIVESQGGRIARKSVEGRLKPGEVRLAYRWLGRMKGLEKSRLSQFSED